MDVRCKGLYCQLKGCLQYVGKNCILEFLSHVCSFLFVPNWTDFAKVSLGKKEWDIIANFDGDEEGYKIVTHPSAQLVTSAMNKMKLLFLG